MALSPETPRYTAETDYSELPADIHAVTQAIIMNSTGPNRGGTFRIDHLEEDTLTTVREVLEANVGEQLPRFYHNEKGKYVSGGRLPVIEPRHTQFKQKGEPYEIEGHALGTSAMLSVPIYDAEPETTNKWPLTKRETLGIGALVVSINVANYDGVVNHRPLEVAAGGVVAFLTALGVARKLFPDEFPFAKKHKSSPC